MRNDSCEPGSQIQGRMMFYSKCWECGSWSLLGTICSWWLTIMGKWFYCFHIRQEKWYLCMSLKKGCCWASSSSFVMYLLRIILALYNFRSFMKESGSIVIALHGMILILQVCMKGKDCRLYRLGSSFHEVPSQTEPWLSFWPSVVLSIPLPRAVWMRLWRSRPAKTVGAEHEQTRHGNHVWCLIFREGIAQ